MYHSSILPTNSFKHMINEGIADWLIGILYFKHRYVNYSGGVPSEMSEEEKLQLIFQCSKCI